MTCQELGRLAGWSAAKVSRIETGQLGLDPPDTVLYVGLAGSCGRRPGFAPEGVAVRDSKNTSGPTLTFGPEAWRNLLARW